LSRLDSVLLFVVTFGTIRPYIFVYSKHVVCLIIKYVHDWRSSIHWRRNKMLRSIVIVYLAIKA
jgi:hypothetical protein